MTDRTATFDLCGARLRVTADADIWVERLCRAFKPFLTNDSPSPAREFVLTIHETAMPDVSHQLPLTWEGRQADGHMGRVFENERMAILEVMDGGISVIDHGAGTAVAHLRPGSQPQFFGSAIMLIVDAALTAAGQELVHGASLIEPRSGLAVLIVVPSGGGKTTTALALARGGFRLMSDDASVLLPDRVSPRIWGMPRMLKVHRRTADLLPWVGPLTDKWDENGEQGVSLESIGDRIAIAEPGPVALGAIILLGPRASGGSRVAPLAKSEILTAIAHDNVAWRPAGMTPKAVRRFEAFARTVAQVPAFRLSAGTDLASLPDVLRTGLDLPVKATDDRR